MELHDALKNLLSTQDMSMLANLQIINFLNDYHCFVDKPAMKLILRDIIRSGYAEEILALSPNDAAWRTKFKHYVHDFIDSCGYKEELASYVFESIAYALNLNVYNEEPKIRQKVDVDSFFDLDEEESPAVTPPASVPQGKPQVDPQDTFAIAQTFFNEKKYQQAKAFIERAILNYTKGQVPSHFFLLKGDVLRCLDLYSEAIAAYNECLATKALELKKTADVLREAIKKHEVKGYENFIFHYFFCLYSTQRVSNDKWLSILKKEARSGSFEALIYCANNGIDPIEEHINIFFVDRKQLQSGDYLYEDGTFSHELTKSKKAVAMVVLTETSDFEKSQGWTNGYLIGMERLDMLHIVNRYGSPIPTAGVQWATSKIELPFPHSHYTIDDITHWDKATKVYSEYLIRIDDAHISEFPAFEIVRTYKLHIPIPSSGWFLPSATLLTSGKFGKEFNNFLSRSVGSGHFWTSSQVDSVSALVVDTNFLRVSSYPKDSYYQVLPIAAF